MHSRILRVGGAILALTAAASAHAQDSVEPGPHHWSANVGVVSQYAFRGLTQTNERPAVQGGFDYAHASGAYVGTWLSNVSWFSDANAGNSNSLEWDLYGGFKKTWANGLSTDVGYLRYQYPGSYRALPLGTVKPHTDEAYAAVGWKWASLKYSYTFSDLFGVEDSDGSDYLDLTVTAPLSERFSIAAHAGRQRYSGASTAAVLAGTSNDDLYSYEDYRATLTYSLAPGWSALVTGTHTNARDTGYTILGKNIGDDQIVVGLTRSF